MYGGARMRSITRGLLALMMGGLLAGMGPAQAQEGAANAFSRPVAGLNEADWARFQQGLALFNQSWSVAGVGNPSLDGLGLTAVVSEQARYLHDGRARSLTEAVLWHGGEATRARRRFEVLPEGKRQALLAFLQRL